MTEERNTAAPETEESRNFILNLIDQDIAEGGQFRDRPSTPGFRRAQRLSAIGHCKALCIDFGTAEKFGGLCNLRMDDTNPLRRTPSTWTPSSRISIGWALTGATAFSAAPTTSRRTTSMPWSLSRGAGLRLRVDARGVQGQPGRHRHPATSPIGIGPSRKICGCSKR